MSTDYTEAACSDNELMGSLNPTHSLTACSDAAVGPVAKQ